MVLPGLRPLAFRGLQTIPHLHRAALFFFNLSCLCSFHCLLCVLSLPGFHYFLPSGFVDALSETKAEDALILLSKDHSDLVCSKKESFCYLFYQVNALNS